jgi:hypothetical protein
MPDADDDASMSILSNPNQPAPAEMARLEQIAQIRHLTDSRIG